MSGTLSIDSAFFGPSIGVYELMSDADRARWAAKFRSEDRFERFESWMLEADRLESVV